MTRLAIAVAATGVLLAACGNGNDGGSRGDGEASIKPIEAILASDVDITVDPSGTTATLTVDTDIPVACAVIYGTDDTYGSIAVDNDMQGGAHHNHGPVLTGLRPDTEYQYVLQGSDAAGAIYRSDPMTFTTPPAADNAFGANIAPSGTVTDVSSEFSQAFGATNAIDGDLGTEWSTAGDGDNAFIEIDLGQPHTITAIAFRTRQMTDGTAITNTFTVTIADQVYGPYAAGAEPTVLDQRITAQTVRIDADQTTGGNTGATEIEIYAPG